MSFPKSYDGAMSLGELEQACEMEQSAGIQLNSIQFGTQITDGVVFAVNKAAYEEKIIGRLRNLAFTEVKDNDDPTKIRESVEKEGWTFICDTQIYVSNQIMRVIVAGQKNF